MRKMLGLFLLLAAPVMAYENQSLLQQLVAPVTQQDGDTILNASVSVGVCPGTICPTTLSAPPTTNFVLRKRTFINTGSFKVWIGSNTTTLTSTGYLLTEATGTSPSYTTNNSATFYANAVTTGTVAVLTEYNSVP